MSSEDYRSGEVARLGPALSPEEGSVPATQQMWSTTATPGTQLEATPSFSKNRPNLPGGQDAQCQLAKADGKRVDSSGEDESVYLPAQCELAETCARIDQSDDLTASRDPQSWSDAVHRPYLSANNNSNTSPRDGSLSLSRQSLGEREISANQQEPTGTQDIDSRQPVIEDQDVLNVDVQVPTDQSDISRRPSSREQPNVSPQPSPGRSNTRYGPTSRRAIPPGQGLLSQRPDSFQRTPRIKPEPSNQQLSPGPSQQSSPIKVDVGSPRATSEESNWQSSTSTTNASNWKSSLKEPDSQSRRWPPERPGERSHAPSSEKLDKNKLSSGSSQQQPWNERADKRNEKSWPDKKETDVGRVTDKQNQLLPRTKVDKKSIQQANTGTDSPKKVNTSTSNQPAKKKSDSPNYQPSTEKSGLTNYQPSKESYMVPRSQQSKERPTLLDRHLITEKEGGALKKDGSDESHLQLTSRSLDTPNLSNPQSSLSKSPRLESPDGQSFKDKLHTSSPSRAPKERILPRTNQTSIVEDTRKIPSLEGNPKSPTQKSPKAIEETSPPNTHTDSETPDGDSKGKENLSMDGQSLSKRAGMSSWHSSGKQHPSNVQPDSTEEKSNTSVSSDQTEGTRHALASKSEIPLGQSETYGVSKQKLEKIKPVLDTMAPSENVFAKTRKIPLDEKSKNPDSAKGNNFGHLLSKSFLRHPVSDKTPASFSKKAFEVAVIVPGNASTSVDTAQWEPYGKTSTFISVNGRNEVVQSSSVDSDEFRSGASTQEAQERNVKLRENCVVVTDSVTDADGRKNQSDIPPLPDSLNERRVLEGHLERTNIAEHDGLSQSFDHVGDWLDTSLDVSASETPMPLQKKESANGLSEGDISHSETLADVEKSEAAEPQYEKMPIVLVETSQASSVRLRNEVSSVSAVSLGGLDFSQFPGIEPTLEISRPGDLNGRVSDGLRQRQPHLANLPPDMDYEVAEPPERATGFWVGRERTDVAVNDLANQDLPRALNEALRLGILFEIPPAGLGVPDNSGANRILPLNSPYNISFNLMVSMLIITVVLLLNHLRELLWFH